jgi:acyl-CoA synthetase (AMP-forming)/AMP-acid ligase II
MVMQRAAVSTFSNGTKSVDIGSILARAHALFGERPAIIDGARVITYAELADRVNRLASGFLRVGLRSGDRVLDVQHNEHQYIETDLALATAGLVRVPINTRLTMADWAFIAEDSGARGLVFGSGLGEAAGELRHRVPGLEIVIGVDRGPGYAYEDLASGPGEARLAQRRPSRASLVSINYSSGTTGRPKGCMRTLGNRLASMTDMMVDLFQGGLGPADVWLHAGPITHASGLFVLPMIAAGASQVVAPRFDPEAVLSLIAQHRVTGTVLVPTMIERILSVGVDAQSVSSLRWVAYAGAPMMPDRIVSANDAFGGRMVQFYGMVEAIPPLTVLHQEDHRNPLRLGSAGRACMGVDLDVVDERGRSVPVGSTGELVVRGEHVMRGYWGLSEATGKVVRGGALRTGDIARRNDRGYVTLVDRRNDLIISGGYNVFPREVEEVIRRVPGVEDAVVVGIPDAEWGQAVVAAVVMQSGFRMDVNEVNALCRGHLASFKRPKRMVELPALLYTVAGKIDRNGIAQRLVVEGG